mgnify:CR=1 FL=1
MIIFITVASPHRHFLSEHFGSRLFTGELEPCAVPGSFRVALLEAETTSRVLEFGFGICEHRCFVRLQST